MAKKPTAELRIPADGNGRLIVKFQDDVLARATDLFEVESRNDRNMDEANGILRTNNMRAKQAINHSEFTLASLETRAALVSGRGQPDLAGMMYVDGPRGRLLQTARELNDLPDVEWVYFEVKKSIYGPPMCGDVGTGDCFDLMGTGSPFCDTEACCELIGDFDPFCVDPDFGEWDELCAAQANLVCPSPPADRCASPFGGSCFEVHPNGGCNNGPCCNTICTLDPFCCDGFWDDGCVFQALQNCTGIDADGPTPDFQTIQGYLTPQGYEAQLGAIPADLVPFVPLDAMGDPLIGHGGEGFNLSSPGEPFDDQNNNNWWDPGEPFDDFGQDGTAATADFGEGDGQWQKPGGLWGLAEELLYSFEHDEFCEGNLVTGSTIKIGVIEWGYYPDHEDLDVTTEPGQTIILIPEVTEPDHGTACLSIINGRAQTNPRGVKGVVPDAKGYFYPLTSVEEGPREMTAWTSALLEFGPGDVISASYGPGPPAGNLNNEEPMWLLFRVAADLGISVVIAAGNDCYNLDDADDLGDSGATVVGACSPGAPYYRLSFSNFCTAPALTRSNIIHLKAWGELVTSAGYGVLFYPDAGDGSGGNEDRAYTPTFGGTSAAAPQIAGAIAALQGFAKQYFGIPMTPEQIRSAMGAPGTPPNPPARLTGGFGDADCGLDTDPESGPNMIGVYPNLAGDFGSAASSLLSQSGFDDAPLIEDILVVRGNHIYGNKFSIKGSDNNYFVVESVFTPRNHQPSSGGSGSVALSPVASDCGQDLLIGQASEAGYFSGGDITDVIILATADTSAAINAMEVSVERASIPQFDILFIEAYDWVLGDWGFIGISVEGSLDVDGPDADGDLDESADAFAPDRFIRESDDRILLRLWSLGFSLPAAVFTPSDQGNHFQQLDLVTIELEEKFGEPTP